MPIFDESAICEHGLSLSLCAGPGHYPPDDYAPMATEADAHREWHHNAGVPMGTGSCPWDACQPPDDVESEPVPPRPARHEMTAEFPLVGRAKSFADRIREPGWSAYDVVQQGRTVTWKSDSDNDCYVLDMTETVGHYGSDQRRRAKLNGRPAPPTY
jgi:hypothetical protein